MKTLLRQSSGKPTEDDPNIIVAVRVRPKNSRERSNARSFEVIKVLDEKVLCFDPSDNDEADRRGVPAHARSSKDQNFAFDRVFSDTSTQKEVYEQTAARVLDFVMDGFNATVFAYGATGSGKTFTMVGDFQAETRCIEQPGVIVRTLEDLFQRAESRRADITYSFAISYLEVYNETIRDLLADAKQKSKPLELREDQRGMKVAGLTTHDVSSLSAVLGLLNQGNSLRAQSATEANPVSSRSHAVLQILVRSKPRTANVRSTLRTSKLSLIDLAGSERACVTKNRGRLLLEGANINRSLLALGNCINALGDPTSKASYVNYRDSKLTRLLKDSLGGNARTVMITNLSPSSMSYEETHNSLKYANRAKNIKTVAVRNEVAVEMHIHEYKQIIADLRGEISELKVAMTDIRSTGGTDDTRGSTVDEEELEEVTRLRKELALAFQERQHITKAIMDLEDMEWESRFEMRKTKAELFRIQHVTREVAETPLKRKMHGSLSKLEDDIVSNGKMKQRLQRRLEKTIETTKELQDKAVDAVSSEFCRTVLASEIRMQLLELDKLELERRNQDQERQLLERRLLQEEKNMTMKMMQEVIEEQFACLQQHQLVDARLEQGRALIRHLTSTGLETVPDFMVSSRVSPLPLGAAAAAATAASAASGTQLAVPGPSLQHKRKLSPMSQDVSPVLPLPTDGGLLAGSPEAPASPSAVPLASLSLGSPFKSPKHTRHSRPSAPSIPKPPSVWMDAKPAAAVTQASRPAAVRRHVSGHAVSKTGSRSTLLPVLKDMKNVQQQQQQQHKVVRRAATEKATRAAALHTAR